MQAVLFFFWQGRTDGEVHEREKHDYRRENTEYAKKIKQRESRTEEGGCGGQQMGNRVMLPPWLSVIRILCRLKRCTQVEISKKKKKCCSNFLSVKAAAWLKLSNYTPTQL